MNILLILFLLWNYREALNLCDVHLSTGQQCHKRYSEYKYFSC